MGLREEAEAAIVNVTNGIAPRDIEAGEMVRVGLVTNDPGVPDVDTSPIPGRADVPVYVAWQRMMQDVQWLGKERRGDKYMYRGIDDVMNLVGPAERKHGVFVMPTGIEPVFAIINTKGGAAMNYCRAVVHFMIYGPRGDSMPATTLGEGFDTGDKSASKAQSVALRTLYLNALAIQTNEPARDTEYGTQYEIAGPPRPTAAQYHAEIIDERTSIGRLHQIREELDADSVMAHTEVEGLDGERIELGRLVRRVGAARVAGKGQ